MNKDDVKVMFLKPHSDLTIVMIGALVIAYIAEQDKKWQLKFCNISAISYTCKTKQEALDCIYNEIEKFLRSFVIPKSSGAPERKQHERT